MLYVDKSLINFMKVTSLHHQLTTGDISHRVNWKAPTNLLVISATLWDERKVAPLLFALQKHNVIIMVSKI